MCRKFGAFDVRFALRLSTERAAMAVRHYSLMQELNVYAEFGVREEFRVYSFPVLREGPESFARPRL